MINPVESFKPTSPQGDASPSFSAARCTLQVVVMDSGTITTYQLMRLNYIAPGQSMRAMRQWTNDRLPNQVASTTRYPAFTDGKSVDFYRLESQPETCVRLQFSDERYTGYNFGRCPGLEDH